MLALLVKTLRELSTFEAGMQPGEAEDDDEPRDMDALRAELFRRIEALRATARAEAQADTPPPNPSPACGGG